MPAWSNSCEELFLACRLPISHCIFTCWRQREQAFLWLLEVHCSPFSMSSTQWPHLILILFQRPHCLRPSHWQVVFQHKCWEDTNIQSITRSLEFGLMVMLTNQFLMKIVSGNWVNNCISYLPITYKLGITSWSWNLIVKHILWKKLGEPTMKYSKCHSFNTHLMNAENFSRHYTSYCQGFRDD